MEKEVEAIIVNRLEMFKKLKDNVTLIKRKMDDIKMIHVVLIQYPY